jgi:iron complex outermembrane receptor protein
MSRTTATKMLVPAVLTVALQGALAAGASAQQAGDTGGSKEATTLDQITVTSRQRSEKLQDVPIAVTAFSAADIRNAGIARPRDFVALTPNVILNESQNSGTSFITIRGISQVRNSEKPVAVVVDGVPQTSANQFNQELFDIAQIEVLKGPQGALYGNNAIGGAINITTVEPGDTPGGYLQVGAGNGGLLRTQASYGGALDKDGHWRGQVSGFWSDYDGLIKNTYRNETVDNLRSNGVRARLLGEVNDWITADFTASNNHDHGGSLNYVYQPLYGIDDASDASLPITANNHGIDIRKMSQVSAKLDFHYDSGVLTSTSSWSRLNQYYDGDQFPYSPGTTANPLPGWEGLDGTQSQYLYERAVSQELRFTSNADQRLRWIAGIYGQWVDRYISSVIGDDLGQGIVPAKRSPNPADSANPSTSFLADDNDNRTYAVFGQLAYDITPQLEAALALRYDYAKREQTNRAPLGFDANSGEVRQASFHMLQPKATLTWKPDPRFSAFFSYGEGFNSGGFNQSGVSAIAASAGVVGASDKYGQEEAKSYELGFKSRPYQWLEANASLFYTDLKNQPYFVFVGAVGAQIIAPIDKTRLQGAELEVKIAPTRNFALLGGYGYTDSQIRAYGLQPEAIGNDSPYVSRNTGNLGVQYRAEFGEAADATFRVDYRHVSKQYWDPAMTTARQALDLVDARLIVQPVSGTWSLTFWGRNLTDRKYLSEYTLGGFAHPATPRTYGADLRWNF